MDYYAIIYTKLACMHMEKKLTVSMYSMLGNCCNKEATEQYLVGYKFWAKKCNGQSRYGSYATGVTNPYIIS